MKFIGVTGTGTASHGEARCHTDSDNVRNAGTGNCFIAKRWKKNMSETQGQEQFRGKTVVIKQETKT